MPIIIRAVEIGPCRLIRADWRDAIAEVSATAVLTDPPYGIGYVKGASGSPSRPGGSVHRSVKPITGDGEPFDPRPLLGLAPETFLWGANRYHHLLPPSGAWHAWDKLAGAIIRLRSRFG